MSAIRSEDERPIRAGVIAGSVAALIAALVSLPLHSPDDPLLNSATVVVGTLLVGVTAGALWRVLARYPNRPRIFAALWAMAFGLAVLAAVAGEQLLVRFVSFLVPLEAIVFPLVGLLTSVLAGRPAANRWWVAVGTLVFAIGVGVGLSGQGDQQSGRLTLPPRTMLLSPAPAGIQGDRVRRFGVPVQF